MAVKRKALSKQVISTLRAKAKTRKNITLGQLKKVYRRGQGAFLSAGSRPKTSMASWSMGRVNSFMIHTSFTCTVILIKCKVVE